MPGSLFAALLAASLLSQGQSQNPNFPGQFPGGQRRQQQQQTSPAETAAALAPMIEIAPSVTHHTINLPSGALVYTATAAQIPIRSDAGEDVEFGHRGFA